MDERQTVVAAYDATDEAGDGLALARLLAAMTDSDLLVTRVLANSVRSAEYDAVAQRDVRGAVTETRAAMLVAVPQVSRDVPLLPVLDASVAAALHAVAADNDASMLVVGSSHHSRLGRVLLGGTAEQVIDDAPCPVAVAPPGFRASPRIAPALVGCAYDGSLPSVDGLLAAANLARACGTPMRVIVVARPADAKPLFDDAEAVVRDTSGGVVTLECVALEGDPVHQIVAQTEESVGLLVMGSRGLGPLRRALLGSVSTGVIRAAHCPVVVVPRRG